MLTGTLWISRVAPDSDAYRAMTVPYDDTPPSTVLLQNAAGLRAFLSFAGIDDALREGVIEQATRLGLAVLKNVSVKPTAPEPRAA